MEAWVRKEFPFRCFVKKRLSPVLSLTLRHHAGRPRSDPPGCAKVVGGKRDKPREEHKRLVLLGRYVVKEIVGQGTFCTVYKATDTLTDEDKAVKVYADSHRDIGEQVTALLFHPPSKSPPDPPPPRRSSPS